jgi:hypothetical protein
MRNNKAAVLLSLALTFDCARAESDGPKGRNRAPANAFTTGSFKTSFTESADCSQDRVLKDAKPTVSTRNVDTGEKASFYDSAIVRKRAWVKDLRVTNQFIEISVGLDGEFMEFEGVVSHTIEDKNYGGSPLTVLAVNILTAGLPVLLEPSANARRAFGCTDSRIVATGIHSRQAAATGRSKWIPLNDLQEFEIEVETAGRKARRKAPGGGDTPLRIEFPKELLEYIRSPDQVVRVSCLNCEVGDAPQTGTVAPVATNGSLLVKGDFAVYLDGLARQRQEKEERLAAAKAATLARAQAEATARLTALFDMPSMRSLPWRERVDQAVNIELRRWLMPPDQGLAEVASPAYPTALSLKQEVWETNEEFEVRVRTARTERASSIERIQSTYRALVEARNRRVAEYNRVREEREQQLAEYRQMLILTGIRLSRLTVVLSAAALDQQSGALTITARVDGLGEQIFAFAGTPQAFRRAALFDLNSTKGRPHFHVGSAGEISVQALDVDAGGVTAQGRPSSALASSVQVTSVTLDPELVPAISQQSAVTVDRNQVEQILYRDENEMLRKRLEDQRKKQAQAVANAEAKAAAEITRLRAEADALRAQPARPASYAVVNEAHALVIGNSAYPGSNRLVNPANDARAIKQKLESLGFKVTVVNDANRGEMVRGLSNFSKTAASADLSVLFYAGHGFQDSGVNYMAPVDMSLNDRSQATLQAVSLNQAVEQYLPGKTKLVLFDACRDNPLMASSGRGISKGLAPINVSEGTLISYATKDGQTADDGQGQVNSPYTAALLEHLSDPDDIAVVLRTVRAKVMQRTNNRQQPWEYGSLTGGALVLSAIKPPEGKK